MTDVCVEWFIRVSWIRNWFETFSKQAAVKIVFSTLMVTTKFKKLQDLKTSNHHCSKGEEL